MLSAHRIPEIEVKAVRLHTYGGPEVLTYEDNVPDPTPGPDSVLVEAWATSVNPIDWKVRSGARQKDFPLTLPAILGRGRERRGSRGGAQHPHLQAG